MMLRISSMVISIFAVAACSSANERNDHSSVGLNVLQNSSANDSSSEIIVPNIGNCGRGTSRGNVKNLIKGIKSALDSGDFSYYKFRQFISDKITLTRDGKSNIVNGSDIKKISSVITRKEWENIFGVLAAGDLNDAGWRGCFIKGGKVWFEADKRGVIFLTEFDADMPWGDSSKKQE